MGKSTVLTQEAEKLQASVQETGDYFLHVDLSAYGTDLLIIKDIFESREFGEWKDGNTRLHLLLDGFDTCLPRVENLVGLLLTHLANAPRKRLLLRIACRTVDWPADMEDGLRKLWGVEDLGVYELAPLRRRDVAAAAVAVGSDPDLFLTDVDRLAASQFANRPVTLGFLLKSRTVGIPMPEHRADLYREGCRLLCDEWREDRRRSRHRHGLSLGQRFAVARSLAAVSIFCQKAAIWTGALREVAPAHHVRVDELLGNEEQFNREAVVLTEHAIRETLDTGLFRSLGPHRIVFAHQTYAEFLAADYLLAHDVPAPQVLVLVLQSDRRGRVVPQLRETAVWLASVVPDVFRELLRKDSATLFASDTPPITSDDRRAVILQTLKLFDEGELHDLRLVTDATARLKYEGIAEDLEPYIRDDSKSENARRAAVLIARYTKQIVLQAALVRLAIDEDGPPKLRIAAARAVREVGEPSAKAALKPLVTISAERDPDDELKGNALIAMWPEHLTADELFTALSPPQRPNFIGAYREFLSSDFGTGVTPPDRLKALQWAKKHIKLSARTDPLGIAALQLATAAIDWVCGDSQSPEALANLLITIAILRLPHLPLMRKLNANPKARSILAQSAIQACPDVYTAYALVGYGVVGDGDLGDLLDELENNPSCERQATLARFIFFIVSRLHSFDTELMERIFEGAHGNNVLRDALQPALFIELKSERSESLRASYLAVEQSEPPAVQESLTSEISGLLETLDRNDPLAFYKTCSLAGQSTDPDEDEPMPGWRRLVPLVQIELSRAARLYLDCYRADESWVEDRPWQFDAIVGYWALRVLAAESADDLGNLPAATWHAWMPSAFDNTYVFNPPDYLQQRILKAGYRAMPDRFRDLVGRFIDSQSARGQPLAILCVLEPVWDGEIATVLRSQLAGGKLAPPAFGSVLRTLLAAGDGGAATIAAKVIGGASGDASNQMAVEAALAWLESDPCAAWLVVWRILNSNSEFSQQVFGRFARDPFSLSSSHVIQGLREQQLADWLIWLARKINESLETAETGERPSVGLLASLNTSRGWQALRAVVMNELIHRGTEEAVAAIRYVDEKAPDASLKRLAEMAQDFVSRKTWAPLSPTELLDFIARPSTAPPSINHAGELEVEQGMGLATTQAGGDHKGVFRKRGAFWELEFGGERVSAKHVIGMAYITHLLRAPGRSFSCTELQAAEHRYPSHTPKLNEQDEAALPNSETTRYEVLDETVREQYKDRLDSSEKELLAAEACNDIGRAEQLRAERKVLLAELKSHTGLHGRARTFSTDSERARKAVAGAVRTALRNIGKHHREMVEHLNRHLELGGSCRYEADGVDWEF